VLKNELEEEESDRWARRRRRARGRQRGRSCWASAPRRARRRAPRATRSSSAVPPCCRASPASSPRTTRRSRTTPRGMCTLQFQHQPVNPLAAVTSLGVKLFHVHHEKYKRYLECAEETIKFDVCIRPWRLKGLMILLIDYNT
jgi:hypothetical protein